MRERNITGVALNVGRIGVPNTENLLVREIWRSAIDRWVLGEKPPAWFTTDKRYCKTPGCHADITDRHYAAVYCVECSQARIKKQGAGYYKKSLEI